MRRKQTVLVLCLAGLASPLYGQTNLLVNGSFGDPAVAQVRISDAGVADGDTIEIDTAGANRIYEFDTNGSVAAGNVLVNVSGGTGRTNAHDKLRAAINADALAPCTAAAERGGDPAYATVLNWKGVGGMDAVNANTVDTKDSITVSNFADSAACPHSTVPVLGWTGLSNRNDTLYVPACLDGAHASLQGWGFNIVQTYQTVTVTPNTLYTLSGVWWVGHMDSFGYNRVTAELHDGPNPTDPQLAQVQFDKTGIGDTGAWLPFSVNGTPTGTQLTVVLKANNTSPTGFALHVDNCSLVEATCFDPPTVTGISPAYGARGAVLTDVTIIGTNFTPGKTSVKLSRGGTPDIVATNVNVTGSTSLTCTLDLTGVPTSLRDVVVTVADTIPNQYQCGPAVLSGAFKVILPAFANGSFELPEAPGGCPVTPLPGVPTDWHFDEIAGYGYEQAFMRDLDVFVPSCPPRDGLHYASSFSDNDGGAGAEAQFYQTFAVTPNTGYSLSGEFAGGGPNLVKLELRDGDVNAVALNSATIHEDTGGAYDWTYASVFGQPTGGMMTAVWTIKLNGPQPHAVHADNLTVEVCNTPLEIVGIMPNIGVGDGPITITNLSGSGFVVGGSPLVQLVKGNTRITATDVVVFSPNQITCKFDLTGATSGKYTVMVKQGGCAGVLPASDPGAFLVVASEFMNGDFEDPTAAQDCGPPPVVVGGFPTGWNSNANLVRDGNAPVPPSCPSPAEGHYASMGSDQANTLQAWQTVRVLPGQQYTFSGWFGGPSDSYIALIDGDEAGTLLASQQVISGGGQDQWHEGSISATAASSVMTILWEVSTTSATPGGHADGLQFNSNCNAIWADGDNDGDVDMDDFAFWQRCISITGTSESDPPYCRCFDRVAPFGKVDELDFPAFSHCVSGPDIPWTTCEP